MLPLTLRSKRSTPSTFRTWLLCGFLWRNWPVRCCSAAGWRPGGTKPGGCDQNSSGLIHMSRTSFLEAAGSPKTLPRPRKPFRKRGALACLGGDPVELQLVLLLGLPMSTSVESLWALPRAIIKRWSSIFSAFGALGNTRFCDSGSWAVGQLAFEAELAPPIKESSSHEHREAV